MRVLRGAEARAAHSALFIGTAQDPHLEVARDRLAGEGVEVTVLDPCAPVELDIQPAPFRLTAAGRVLDPGLVWWRWKEPLVRRTAQDKSSLHLSEWLGVAQSLRYHFADRNLHHPDALNRAGQKILQLGWAKQVGFATPETLISNNPASVRAFVQEARIVKSICTPQVYTDDGFTGFDTQCVEPALVRSLCDDALRVAPSLIQTRINKVSEVRATYVCGRIRAKRYFPKAVLDFDPAQRDDWRALYRYADMDLTDSEDAKMSDEMIQRIKAYADQSRMRILCLDFAELDDGRSVFLEANPDGQWTWLDQTGELMDALVGWALEFIRKGPGNV